MINNNYDNWHSEPPECGNEVCKRTVTQKADVTTPVEIKPVAVVGHIESKCLGEPKVVSSQCKDTCQLTITQTISTTIPIKYKVSAEVGESEVNCHPL